MSAPRTDGWEGRMSAAPPPARRLSGLRVWQNNQAWLTPLLLLVLPVGLFGLLIITPIVQSIWISFYDWDGTGPATWVGLSNYAELFSDPQFYTSLKNNVIWLVLFLLAPVFGLALALFLNQTLPEMRLVKSIFFIPLVLAHVIIGVVFTWFYDPTFGLLAILFNWLGLEPLAILSDEHFVTFGIIAAALWSQIAFCLVLFLAGLSQLDQELIAAGRMDGAAGWSLLRHIVLPQLRSVSFVASIITVIMSLRNFDMIAVMTQGGPYGSSTVLAYQMYDATIFSYRAGYGAAIATVLFAIMSVYIAWFLWHTLRREARGG
ncbi:carbohydrate ABC transporter permease [Azospirillum oryzae]|nr:sugar ABC transporter permease [Azospirillum oryzae]